MKNCTLSVILLPHHPHIEIGLSRTKYLVKKQLKFRVSTGVKSLEFSCNTIDMIAKITLVDLRCVTDLFERSLLRTNRAHIELIKTEPHYLLKLLLIDG